MNATWRILRSLKPDVKPLIILAIVSFVSVDNLRQNLYSRRRDIPLAKFLGKEKLDRPALACRKTGGTLIKDHGGDFSHHLPNTVEATHSVIARRVRCIEADGTSTSDGHLMVVHKCDLIAMTQKGGTVTNIFTTQLIFDIASRENVHIPTFEKY